MTRRPLSVVLLLVLLTGCRVAPGVPPEVVAVIDGDHLSYRSFVEYLRRNEGEGSEALGSEVLSALLDQFLEEEMLIRWGREEGVIREGQNRRSALASVLAQVAAGVPDPAPWEVATALEQGREELIRGERVDLRQILVDEERVAEATRARWEQGESFEELAREVSQDPTAPFGGHQGAFCREDLPPEVADVVFDLEDGQVSEVIRTGSGYHLFQVVQHLDGGLSEKAELEEKIRARLREGAMEGALGRLVSEGARKYNARVYVENLPFEYSGPYAQPEGQ